MIVKLRGMEFEATPLTASQLSLKPNSISSTENGLSATVLSSEAGAAPMSLHVRCMASGAVQVRMEEVGMQPRWESPDIVTKDTLKPAAGVGLLPGSDATAVEHLRTTPDASVLAFAGPGGQQVQVVVSPSPLSVKVFVEAQEMVAINSL